ncbi:MAG: protein kinase, partial [Candidatus Krumholzibacteria bacterium]|nr:protein kinase [Candidatus Krumholzibacteria bacterium]
MEGKQIAGYVIETTLGEGGMGVVYRARDATLDRPVAVKVIHSQKLGEQGKERFLREARACSRITHPNIITVYAAGEEDGCPYIAMELIDGETLRQIIDEGPIEWKKAVRCLIDLLDAVGRLHEEGIVHRDLKPENIMITKDGVVKLMDFGLAHLQSSTTFTEEGTTLGTIPYMSPEQVMGNKADARSDLFSIASVFHEMITGLHPFRGEHPMAVMYSIRNDTPRALKLASQELPVGMQAVLDRAFEKEIDKRYQDAKTFREELITLLPDDVLNGSRIKSGGTAGRKRSLTPAVIVAAAILIMGGVIGWNALRDGALQVDRGAAVNLNELGQDKQGAGYIDEAITLYRESIRADDTYPIPWNNLGMIALSQNDLVEADSLFREALERASTYANAWYNRGAVAA